MQTAPSPNSTAYDRWARYYDLGEGDREPYLRFYLSLLLPTTRSVFEIGCGTGIIASAMAAELRGRPDDGPVRVAGLDASLPMLDIARARDPSVDWLLGDMRDPPVQARFDLVFCCFNTFQFMLSDDDLARALAAARNLVNAQGQFAFDLYQPNIPYLEVPRTGTLTRRLRHDGRDLHLLEDASYQASERLLDLEWRLVDASEPAVDLARTHFRIRQYFAADVERMLATAGFTILERFGGLDRSAFTAESKKQVYLCAPR